ncbi:unnamed protein product [Heligmosomoides polygyrus]|uniref:Secreted protein n=1 Tax=Heligmosomoides polygyrus TaxID=6339 RepID=A0A183F5J8_HELPZ|nr:unnamed protein product [Heligmosomoides polygyrus]
MALLPMNSFPGCVFIEARMLGQPAAVVSQVGLSIDAPDCSVAVFCKCSLCFLTSYLNQMQIVIGASSHCASTILIGFLYKKDPMKGDPTYSGWFS